MTGKSSSPAFQRYPGRGLTLKTSIFPLWVKSYTHKIGEWNVTLAGRAGSTASLVYRSRRRSKGPARAALVRLRFGIALSSANRRPGVMGSHRHKSSESPAMHSILFRYEWNRPDVEAPSILVVYDRQMSVGPESERRGKAKGGDVAPAASAAAAAADDEDIGD
ncbi:hypothetical protein THAOC_23913, partial [Thalassiosira oceanica]